MGGFATGLLAVSFAMMHFLVTALDVFFLCLD